MYSLCKKFFVVLLTYLLWLPGTVQAPKLSELPDIQAFLTSIGAQLPEDTEINEQYKSFLKNSIKSYNNSDAIELGEHSKKDLNRLSWALYDHVTVRPSLIKLGNPDIGLKSLSSEQKEEIVNLSKKTIDSTHPKLSDHNGNVDTWIGALQKHVAERSRGEASTAAATQDDANATSSRTKTEATGAPDAATRSRTLLRTTGIVVQAAAGPKSKSSNRSGAGAPTVGPTLPTTTATGSVHVNADTPAAATTHTTATTGQLHHDGADAFVADTRSPKTAHSVSSHSSSQTSQQQGSDDTQTADTVIGGSAGPAPQPLHVESGGTTTLHAVMRATDASGTSTPQGLIDSASIAGLISPNKKDPLPRAAAPSRLSVSRDGAPAQSIEYQSPRAVSPLSVAATAASAAPTTAASSSQDHSAKSQSARLTSLTVDTTSLTDQSADARRRLASPSFSNSVYSFDDIDSPSSIRSVASSDFDEHTAPQRPSGKPRKIQIGSGKPGASRSTRIPLKTREQLRQEIEADRQKGKETELAEKLSKLNDEISAHEETETLHSAIGKTSTTYAHALQDKLFAIKHEHAKTFGTAEDRAALKKEYQAIMKARKSHQPDTSHHAPAPRSTGRPSAAESFGRNVHRARLQGH